MYLNFEVKRKQFYDFRKTENMKAIILISSIFYILGLKLSHKFDLVKRTESAEKIISHTVPVKKSDKTIDLSNELKAPSDSLNVDITIEKN